MNHPSPAHRPPDPEGTGRAELTRLAGDLDDVDVVSKSPAFAAGGTRAEKRGTRLVLLWLAVSALAGLGFVAAYLLWPHDYTAPSEPGYLVYAFYTPVIGGTFSIAVLALGIGLITYLKNFFPDEVAVQQRHDGPSSETARATTAARLGEAFHDTALPRRPLIARAMLAATGVVGLTNGVLVIGGFVRNPWEGGKQGALRVTGWRPVNGETVYLRTQTGVLGQIERVRPENLEPGSMQTVFPFRESDRGNQQLLLAAERASDTPVMLIRLRPGTPVAKRHGQEDFNYGDYYAFSKICTHLGCPASEYDQRTDIALCPCHQSQFLITQSAQPVFGPATRSLPQLPITVNDEGYFIARGDFIEPVGPGFWEMRAP